MSLRRSLPAALVVIAALGTAATGVPGAGAATTKRVIIKDIDFTPATVTITRGSRVTWVWRDGSVPHDVTSRGTKRFRSTPEAKNTGTYTVRFTRPGTYRYVCTIHANMRGKVVVR